jgi:hypothetical protein
VKAFLRTLKSEAVKLASWPFARWLVPLALLAGLAGAAGFAATATLTTGRAPDLLSARELAETALLGTDLTALVMAVLAAALVAAEFSSGMIGPTLLASPVRLRVATAKLTLVLLLGVSAGTVAAVTSFLLGQAVFALQGAARVPLAGWLAQLIAGTALMVPVDMLLAASLAFLFRRTGAALTGFGLILLLPVVFPALPAPAGWILAGLQPMAALQVIAGSAGPTGIPAAVLVLLAWLVIMTAAALVSFTSRDA